MIKILHTIKQIEIVACQLLVVVGCKINEILNSNFDANLVSILSTNLSSWLKALVISNKLKFLIWNCFNFLRFK